VSIPITKDFHHGLLGEYADVSRRLARLGHIAFFGLGILNLLLVREFPTLAISNRYRRLACRAMNFGNIFLPLTLFAAAFWHPLKYTMPLPACSVFLALLICAHGALQTPHGDARSHC
jgi:hypothetical protein